MKIVKPGKLPDLIAFTCSVCGCEYEADSKDYELSDIAPTATAFLKPTRKNTK